MSGDLKSAEADPSPSKLETSEAVAENVEPKEQSKPSEDTADTDAPAKVQDEQSEIPEKKDLKKEGNDDEPQSEPRSQSPSENKRRRDDDRPYKKPFVNYKDNIKSKYDKLPETSDPDEIRKQVEFYFSDSNLCTDKYLYTQTGGSENKPVPIKVIHSFKRMKRFQPYSAVVNALKDSKILDVVNNGEDVKRKVPIDLEKDTSFEDVAEIIEDKQMGRSIYAKGFGKETSTTQMDIEEFFEPYGPVLSVRLRRTFPEKLFKGSVFVEFESVECMQEFLDLESKPKWEGEDLKIMSKKQYCDMKRDDINSGKIRGNENRYDNRNRGRGNHRGRGGRDYNNRRDGRGRDGDRRDRRNNRNGDDWNGRREEFQKNGYKERNGRENYGREDKGRRNGRSPRRSDDGEGTKPVQTHDENGIPIVQTSSPKTTPKKETAMKSEGDTTAGATDAPTKTEPSNGTKRAREDDVEAAEQTNVKKAKSEVATAA